MITGHLQAKVWVCISRVLAVKRKMLSLSATKVSKDSGDKHTYSFRLHLCWRPRRIRIMFLGYILKLRLTLSILRLLHPLCGIWLAVTGLSNLLRRAIHHRLACKGCITAQRVLWRWSQPQYPRQAHSYCPHYMIYYLYGSRILICVCLRGNSKYFSQAKEWFLFNDRHRRWSLLIIFLAAYSVVCACMEQCVPTSCATWKFFPRRGWKQATHPRPSGRDFRPEGSTTITGCRRFQVRSKSHVLWIHSS